MKVLTEILNSIKVIKFNNWVQQFKQKINTTRRNEVKAVGKRFAMSIGNMFVIFTTNPLLGLVCLVAGISYGVKIDVATAFLMMSIITLIKEPVRWLPFFLGALVEFLVSMKRIEQFLMADEIDPFTVKTLEGIAKNQSMDAVSINDASFMWSKDDDQKKGDKKQEDSKLDIEEGKEENDLIVLKSIGLKVKKGSLVCIIGEVGSGKTSLIHAILGDLKEANAGYGTMVGVTTAPVTVAGSIALAQQVPWI